MTLGTHRTGIFKERYSDRGLAMMEKIVNEPQVGSSPLTYLVAGRFVIHSRMIQSTHTRQHSGRMSTSDLWFPLFCILKPTSQSQLIHVNTISRIHNPAESVQLPIALLSEPGTATVSEYPLHPIARHHRLHYGYGRRIVCAPVKIFSSTAISLCSLSI